MREEDDERSGGAYLIERNKRCEGTRGGDEEGTPATRLLLFSCLIAGQTGLYWPLRPPFLVRFCSSPPSSSVSLPPASPPSPPVPPLPCHAPLLGPTPPAPSTHRPPQRSLPSPRDRTRWTAIRPFPRCLCHLPHLGTSLCPLYPSLLPSEQMPPFSSMHHTTPSPNRSIHFPANSLLPLRSPLRNSPRTFRRCQFTRRPLLPLIISARVPWSRALTRPFANFACRRYNS
jgi:hypothetical protein